MLELARSRGRSPSRDRAVSSFANIVTWSALSVISAAWRSFDTDRITCASTGGGGTSSASRSSFSSAWRTVQRVGRLHVPKRHVDLHRVPLTRNAPGFPGRGPFSRTALRFEEGRMPMSSRYFATVRRAMSICSLASISAMYWSLRRLACGLRRDDVADLLLDALRRDLVAVAAAQARGEEILELEVPCGVCDVLVRPSRG